MRKNGGFTFLEVMIAITIIAIAVTAILGNQSQSISLANEAKFGTTAAFLAQKKLGETIFQERFDLTRDSGDFGEEFPGYTWEATVDDVEHDEFNLPRNLKRISVEVNWGGENLFSYSLSALRLVKD